MLRTTTKEMLLTEENLLYTSGEVLRLLEAIKGEIEPTGGNRTGSDD